MATILSMLRSSAVLLTFAMMACVGGSGPAGSSAQAGANAEPKAEPAAARASSAPRPEFVAAEAGPVDVVVTAAAQAARKQSRRLMVYVGATWCEPCQAFHDAIERGELDDVLAGVRFVEFDSDHDGERLRAAGYDGRYIPRFVVPGPDGRGGPRRLEGGIKGAGAVDHIMRRLGPMLASVE